MMQQSFITIFHLLRAHHTVLFRARVVNGDHRYLLLLCTRQDTYRNTLGTHSRTAKKKNTSSSREKTETAAMPSAPLRSVAGLLRGGKPTTRGPFFPSKPAKKKKQEKQIIHVFPQVLRSVAMLTPAPPGGLNGGHEKGRLGRSNGMRLQLCLYLVYRAERAKLSAKQPAQGRNGQRENNVNRGREGHPAARNPPPRCPLL